MRFIRLNENKIGLTTLYKIDVLQLTKPARLNADRKPFCAKI